MTSRTPYTRETVRSIRAWAPYKSPDEVSRDLSWDIHFLLRVCRDHGITFEKPKSGDAVPPAPRQEMTPVEAIRNRFNPPVLDPQLSRRRGRPSTLRRDADVAAINVGLMMPEPMVIAIDRHARSEFVSRSEAIRALVQSGLDNKKRKGAAP